ncbi:hypothetical protein [Saccharopolyspora sp. NPDC002686]|uniref:hypothetical protein n=1 Tax=Saccharopolyspora sp. NPDC002686 TaxID=3154541 RepID=UPI00331DD20E
MVRHKEDQLDEPDEKDSDEEQKAKKIDIKPAQVAGAATASVTAAFLGSRLGVAGTVIGAGMTSVIITVGGALYQRSFENAKDKALVAAVKAKRATRVHARQLPAELRKMAEARKSSEETRKATEQARKALGETTRVLSLEATRKVDPAKPASEEATRRIHVAPGMQWPGGEQVVDSEGTKRIDLSTAVVEVPEESPVPVDRRKVRKRWVMAAASCVVAFVLAMLVVTGFEGITGRPLSGEESGTTLGHVLDRQPREEVAPPPTKVEKPVETTTREPAPSTEVPSTPPPTQPPSTEQIPTQQPTQPTTTEQVPTEQQTQTEQPTETAPPTGLFQDPRMN